MNKTYKRGLATDPEDIKGLAAIVAENGHGKNLEGVAKDLGLDPNKITAQQLIDMASMAGMEVKLQITYEEKKIVPASPVSAEPKNVVEPPF